MLIYKIFRGPEWDQMQRDGETAGAPIDIADGYVHFSTAQQAQETADKHFAGQDGLWLLAIETEGKEADFRWEVSRGGALFPHLYRNLRMNDVVWSAPLPLVDGRHRFPDLT